MNRWILLNMHQQKQQPTNKSIAGNSNQAIFTNIPTAVRVGKRLLFTLILPNPTRQNLSAFN